MDSHRFKPAPARRDYPMLLPESQANSGSQASSSAGGGLNAASSLSQQPAVSRPELMLTAPRETAALLAPELVRLSEGQLTGDQAIRHALDIARCAWNGTINFSRLEGPVEESAMLLDKYAYSLLDDLSQRSGAPVTTMQGSLRMTSRFDESTWAALPQMIVALSGLPNLREITLTIPENSRGVYDVCLLRETSVTNVLVVLPKYDCEWSLRTALAVRVEARGSRGVNPTFVEVVDRERGTSTRVGLPMAAPKTQASPQQFHASPQLHASPGAQMHAPPQQVHVSPQIQGLAPQKKALVDEFFELVVANRSGMRRLTQATGLERHEVHKILFSSLDVITGTIVLDQSGDNALELANLGPDLFRLMAQAANLQGHTITSVKFSPNLTVEIFGTTQQLVPLSKERCQRIADGLQHMPDLSSVQVMVPSRGEGGIDTVCLELLGAPLQEVQVSLPKTYYGGGNGHSIVLPRHCTLTRTQAAGTIPGGGVWMPAPDGRSLIPAQLPARWRTENSSRSNTPGTPFSPFSPFSPYSPYSPGAPFSPAMPSIASSSYDVPGTSNPLSTPNAPRPAAKGSPPVARSPLETDAIWNADAGLDATDWESPPPVAAVSLPSPVQLAVGLGDVVLHTRANGGEFDHLQPSVGQWALSHPTKLDFDGNSNLFFGLANLSSADWSNVRAAADGVVAINLPKWSVQTLLKPKRVFENMGQRAVPERTRIPGAKELISASHLEVDAPPLQSGQALDLRGFAVVSEGLDRTVAINLPAKIGPCDIHLDASVRVTLYCDDTEAGGRVNLFFWDGNTPEGPVHTVTEQR